MAITRFQFCQESNKKLSKTGRGAQDCFLNYFLHSKHCSKAISCWRPLRKLVGPHSLLQGTIHGMKHSALGIRKWRACPKNNSINEYQSMLRFFELHRLNQQLLCHTAGSTGGSAFRYENHVANKPCETLSVCHGCNVRNSYSKLPNGNLGVESRKTSRLRVCPIDRVNNWREAMTRIQLETANGFKMTSNFCRFEILCRFCAAAVFPKALRKGPSKERVRTWPPTLDYSKMMLLADHQPLTTARW